MTDRGWSDLNDGLEHRFGELKRSRRTEPLEDAPELTQTIEAIEFTVGGQTYKIERVTRPVVLDKKSYYHKAAGSQTRVEYVYDPEETSSKVIFYQQGGADWQEITPDEFASAI